MMYVVHQQNNDNFVMTYGVHQQNNDGKMEMEHTDRQRQKWGKNYNLNVGSHNKSDAKPDIFNRRPKLQMSNAAQESIEHLF